MGCEHKVCNSTYIFISHFGMKLFCTAVGH